MLSSCLFVSVRAEGGAEEAAAEGAAAPTGGGAVQHLAGLEPAHPAPLGPHVGGDVTVMMSRCL